jgi:F-type H+-transporting ATPase subunit epsilon
MSTVSGTAELVGDEKSAKLGQHTLKCVVVTPEKTLFDELVDFVALPLYDGEIGILPGRSPMIGRVGYGALRTKTGESNRQLYVDGGFVQVRDNIVTVLTNRAIPVDQLDASVAAKELEKAENLKGTSEQDLSEKAKSLARARAMVRLAGQGK